MLFASVMLLSGVCSAGDLVNAMPARVVDSWTVEVGPGTVQAGSQSISVPKAVRLEVVPPEIVRVRDERHERLPVFNDKAGGWMKGAKLEKLIAEECTATGLLYPESFRLKAGAGDAAPLKAGVDYQIDLFWGTFGRVDGGGIGPDQAAFADYDCSLSRLDSVVVDREGNVRLLAGKPHVALALAPKTAAGEVAVVNVWVPGRTEKLTDENLFPIEFREPPPEDRTGEAAGKLLPKTLAKLRAGQPVTIVAFGDSVTHGGGVGADEKLWYQHQFAELLRKRFPKSAITMLTAAWPGGNSKGYMEAPKGGTYDFVRDVLDPKPDLVTIEFVNDAYLDEAGTAAHYTVILERLRGIGAEVILITPHLVRPDWMNVTSLKFDEDPRPYVKGLRQFAAANHVALADASRGWCRLWRQGIPYVTIEANGINHPDVRGHALFARALIGLFPES